MEKRKCKKISRYAIRYLGLGNYMIEKSGIYRIKNKVNNKSYVGSSVNMIRRFSKHRSNLNKDQHENNYLQKEWNKFGKDNFEFEMLCIIKENKREILKELLLQKEEEIIELLKSNRTENGYNLQVVKKEKKEKRNNKGITESFRKQLSKSQNHRKLAVVQLTLDGKFVNKFESLTKANKETGVHKTNIQRTCEGKRLTAGNFLWVYEKDYDENKEYKARKPDYNKRAYMKPVLQFDLEMNLIEEHESLCSAANKTGFHKGNIGKVCKEKQNTAYGFKWFYKDNYEKLMMEALLSA